MNGLAVAMIVVGLILLLAVPLGVLSLTKQISFNTDYSTYMWEAIGLSTFLGLMFVVGGVVLNTKISQLDELDEENQQLIEKEKHHKDRDVSSPTIIYAPFPQSSTDYGIQRTQRTQEYAKPQSNQTPYLEELKQKQQRKSTPQTNYGSVSQLTMKAPLKSQVKTPSNRSSSEYGTIKFPGVDKNENPYGSVPTKEMMENAYGRVPGKNNEELGYGNIPSFDLI